MLAQCYCFYMEATYYGKSQFISVYGTLKYREQQID